MREIRTSGLTSGDGKRGDAAWPKPPRPSSTLPGGSRYTTLLRAIELWRSVQADGPGRLAGDEEPPPGDGLVVGRKQDLSQQPTCADGAPLWVKMVALRAGLAEPLDCDRVEAGKSAVACYPDQQSGPRCAEVPFFVAPGTREHAWQCLERTCGATI